MNDPLFQILGMALVALLWQISRADDLLSDSEDGLRNADLREVYSLDLIVSSLFRTRYKVKFRSYADSYVI